jgi:hypothetical protein
MRRDSLLCNFVLPCSTPAAHHSAVRLRAYSLQSIITACFASDMFLSLSLGHRDNTPIAARQRYTTGTKRLCTHHAHSRDYLNNVDY